MKPTNRILSLSELIVGKTYYHPWESYVNRLGKECRVTFAKKFKKIHEPVKTRTINGGEAILHFQDSSGKKYFGDPHGTYFLTARECTQYINEEMENK